MAMPFQLEGYVARVYREGNAAPISRTSNVTLSTTINESGYVATAVPHQEEMRRSRRSGWKGHSPGKKKHSRKRKRCRGESIVYSTFTTCD